VLLLPAVDFVLYRFDRGPLGRGGYAMFVAIAAAYLIARSKFAPGDASFLVAPSRYFLKQLIGPPYALFSQPWNAAELHPWPIVPAALGVALLGLLFVRVVVRREANRLLVGPAIIMITTLPVYSFFFVGPDLAGARYLYFAAAGWAIVLTELLRGLPNRIAMAAGVAALLALSFVFLRANARPWDVADAVVTTMRQEALRGEPTLDTMTRLRSTYGPGFRLKNGIPDSYRGVTIFRNGYPEFLRLSVSESR
jgi:hypothetical protein